MPPASPGPACCRCRRSGRGWRGATVPRPRPSEPAVPRPAPRTARTGRWSACRSRRRPPRRRRPQAAAHAPARESRRRCPSSAAMTPTPRPNPPASTALRTGCDSSDRSARRDDHRVASSTISPVAHPDQAMGARRDRGIVRDDHNRRAVRVQLVEQRAQSARRSPDPARRSARPRAAAAAGWPAPGRWRRAASRRPTAPTGRWPARRRGRHTRAAPGARAPLGAADARLGLRQLDVLERRQHRQEEEPLEHEADLAQPQPAAFRVRQRAHLATLEPHLPAGRHVHAARARAAASTCRSRTARPRRDTRRRDAERHVAQRGNRAGRHREHPRHVARLDDRRGHDTTSRRSVAAIGSVATMRIGYAAAASARSASRPAWRTSARGSNTKKCSSAGTPGMARRMPSSHSDSRPPERHRERAAA